MIDLTVTGLSEDRRTMTLTDPTGAEFRLTIDHRTRMILDQTRRAAEAPMDAQLRPRDIQARVRAGESPEEISEESGLAIAKILPYALPVLDERRHIAETALRASVRGGDGGVLADVTSARLRPAGVPADGIEWDAWRREDGRWSLRATYAVDGDQQQADFVYDAKGRYVLPDDAISRWLVGVVPPRVSTPHSGHTVAAQDELDLALAAGVEDTRQEARRGLRAVSDLAIETTGADADWMVSDPAAHAHRTAEADPEPTAPSDAPRRHEDDQPTRAQLRARAKGRASVPTWDEIMFGSGDRA